MLFDKVTKEHILQGIKDFETKGIPIGFGPFSTYDLECNGKKYPPKAIMAYANFNAIGRTIENYFPGGEGTDCFNSFERNGFNILPKTESTMTNVKNEFLNWILSNPKHNYFSNDRKRLVKELDRSNSFFTIDIFEVNESNYKAIKSLLNKVMYEETDNEFLKYSDKIQNHLPRAVLGKKNYFEFLDQKFKNKGQGSEINYWLFQGNPNIYNIVESLKSPSYRTILSCGISNT